MHTPVGQPDIGHIIIDVKPSIHFIQYGIKRHAWDVIGMADSLITIFCSRDKKCQAKNDAGDMVDIDFMTENPEYPPDGHYEMDVIRSFPFCDCIGKKKRKKKKKKKKPHHDHSDHEKHEESEHDKDNEKDESSESAKPHQDHHSGKTEKHEADSNSSHHAGHGKHTTKHKTSGAPGKDGETPRDPKSTHNTHVDDKKAPANAHGGEKQPDTAKPTSSSSAAVDVVT